MRIALIFLIPVALVAADHSVKFVEHTLATDLKGGYQVIVSDVNHDGKPDLIVGTQDGFFYYWDRVFLDAERARY